MRILLLGSNGQLGKELSRSLSSVGKLKACTRLEVDLIYSGSITDAIDVFKPDIIVNAAAYTAVDKAESERDLAFKINAEAVGVLAKEAALRDIWLIHYSTDYVFDGTKTEPYLETDEPNPINTYGESKLAGEQAITASGCKHFIFRTTWVIGRDGKNFAKTILRLAKERDTLSVINDQFGVPTSPALITKITADAIKALKTDKAWPVGIYHLVPQGETNWFDVAQTLLQLASRAKVSLKSDADSLKAITTTDYPTPASRPANSRLNTDRLEQQIIFKLPNWKEDFSMVAINIIKEFETQ